MMNENLEFNFIEKQCLNHLESDHDKPKILFKEVFSARSKLIHTEAITRAQRYLIAEAELLEIIIEVDSYKIYEELGLSHLTPYCTKHLGLSEDVAANFVRVARKSITVPELKEAINEGRLSVTKAKTIVSVITQYNHSDWIEKAEALTKEKLEKEVAIASPHAKKSERAKPTGPDRVRFEFELSEADAKAFRRAQNLVSQKLKRAATLAETQAELLKVYLEKHDPVEKAQRAKNRSDKKAKSTQPSRDRSKPALAKSNRRAIKAEVLHAVNLRDKSGCQAELPDGTKCKSTRWLDIHHITPKSEGGADTIENLITLCSSHHRVWHKRYEKDRNKI